MKLEIDIADEDLIALGKEAVAKEVQDSIKRLRFRTSFIQASQAIRESWNEQDYYKEVELAREEAWKIYRKEIGL